MWFSVSQTPQRCPHMKPVLIVTGAWTDALGYTQHKTHHRIGSNCNCLKRISYTLFRQKISHYLSAAYIFMKIISFFFVCCWCLVSTCGQKIIRCRCVCVFLCPSLRRLKLIAPPSVRGIYGRRWLSLTHRPYAITSACVKRWRYKNTLRIPHHSQTNAPPIILQFNLSFWVSLCWLTRHTHTKHEHK